MVTAILLFKNVINFQPMRLEETTISINYLALLLRLCEERNIHAENLLKNSGITKETLDNSDGFVNGAQYYQVLKNASQLIGDPTFGLYFGARTSITSHSILGFALMSSQTVRDALIIMCKYHKTQFTILELKLEEDENNAYLRLNFTADFKSYSNLIVEGLISSFYTTFKSMLNKHNKELTQLLSESPIKVEFKQEAPEYSDFFYTILGQNVAFSKKNNQIIVPLELLNLTLPEADPNTAKMAEKICQNILQSLEHRETYPKKVRKLIFANEDNLPTFEQVAHQLNLHPRTLGRRLKQYNTNYQTILDDVRKELALEYLCNEKMNIDDIAFSLRFNDASSFYRAFKKWTGTTPKAFRQKNQLN